VSTGDAPANGAAPTGSDFDCGHCHTFCCTLPALAARLQPLAIASHPVAPVAPVGGTLRTLAQTPPERPQWVRFA
jgi:hypothetical protein